MDGTSWNGERSANGGQVDQEGQIQNSSHSGETGQLLETLITLANLPEESMTDRVRSELHPLVEQTGGTAESLTLEQLRAALALYLESIHLEISQEVES
jgi:hypothetical protein